MRVPLSASLAALIALGVVGCATAPPATTATVAPTAGTSCREVIKPGETEGQVYCGRAEQWAELDRRMALIKAGVTCRVEKPSISEMCMTPEQWEAYGQQRRDRREMLTMGDALRSAQYHGVDVNYGFTTGQSTGAMEPAPPPSVP